MKIEQNKHQDALKDAAFQRAQLQQTVDRLTMELKDAKRDCNHAQERLKALEAEKSEVPCDIIHCCLLTLHRLN